MDKKRARLVLLHPPLRTLVSAATPLYVDKNRGHTPPLGLLYLQAAVEHSRHESMFIDADLEGWDYDEAARHVLSHQPALIGLQAMTEDTREGMAAFREKRKPNWPGR